MMVRSRTEQLSRVTVDISYSTRTVRAVFNIWRVDADGSNQKQLTTNESFAIGAVGSADGKWIVYQALRDGHWDLLKMPGEGGEATRMMERQCIAPAISPDG